MGRFDLLTQLDENQPPVKKPVSAPVAQTKKFSPAPPPEKSIVKETQDKKDMSANLQTRKAAKQSPADFDKVEKYTTHIEPSLMKKIKLWAVEKEMKDYDVVRAALIQYFENNK
jgi:hypothetical protein